MRPYEAGGTPKLVPCGVARILQQGPMLTCTHNATHATLRTSLQHTRGPLWARALVICRDSLESCKRPPPGRQRSLGSHDSPVRTRADAAGGAGQQLCRVRCRKVREPCYKAGLRALRPGCALSAACGTPVSPQEWCKSALPTPPALPPSPPAAPGTRRS